VYGGGNAGNLSGSTNVTVHSGLLNNVYGGARMADVGGRTFVNINGKKASDDIIIVNVYGGNDISGTIGEGADPTTVPTELTNIKTDNEDPALNVETSLDALAGAKDIIAERVSQETSNREAIHDLYMRTGTIKTKGIVPDGQDAALAENTSTYKMYWDYSEPLNEVKPHRILAINRGEREGALEVTIDVDVDAAIADLQRRADIHNNYHKDAIEDGVVRLLSPAVVREIRRDEADEADVHGIGIFSENLKNLLMTQPIKGSRVLGVDPGIRTGTKCAALDETGKYLGYFKFFQVTDPDG
jgi:uncharacterized protein